MNRATGFSLLLALTATPLAAQSFRTLSNSRQRSGEKEISVNVEFAAGRFRMSRDVTGALYHSKIAYNEDRFRPVLDFNDGDLRLGLKTMSVDSHLNMGKREYERQFMELNISPDVPARLNLSFVAGEADVDLGGLNLTGGQIKTGASQSRVTFSSPTVGTCESLDFQVGAAEFRAEQLGNARCRNYDIAGGAGDLTVDFTGNWGSVTAVNADIKIGIGTLHLNLPRDVGIEVQVNRIFSSFDHAGLVKRGDDYYSNNWGSAKVRLHMDIVAALGSVEVTWR